MAEANAAIRQALRLNNYTIYNKTDVQEAVKPAPYLGYGNSSTAAEKKRRVVWRRQLSTNGTNDDSNSTAADSSTFSYTIPPEVVEAARLLAEANPPDSSSDEYDAIVARMKQQYAPKNNDTNAMLQVLQLPSGLLEGLGAFPEAGDNDTAAAHSSAFSRRASTDFWMEKMT